MWLFLPGHSFRFRFLIVFLLCASASAWWCVYRSRLRGVCDLHGNSGNRSSQQGLLRSIYPDPPSSLSLLIS